MIKYISLTLLTLTILLGSPIFYAEAEHADSSQKVEPFECTTVEGEPGEANERCGSPGFWCPNNRTLVNVNDGNPCVSINNIKIKLDDDGNATVIIGQVYSHYTQVYALGRPTMHVKWRDLKGKFMTDKEWNLGYLDWYCGTNDVDDPGWTYNKVYENDFIDKTNGPKFVISNGLVNGCP